MTHIDFVSDHPGVPRMLFGELQRPGETLPKRMAQTLIRHYGERLRGLLEAGKAQGELHADLDPDAAATLFKIGRAQSELQSLMRISYAVFCLKKQTEKEPRKKTNQ